MEWIIHQMPGLGSGGKPVFSLKIPYSMGYSQFISTGKVSGSKFILI
jgi:hypothetical protein